MMDQPQERPSFAEVAARCRQLQADLGQGNLQQGAPFSLYEGGRGGADCEKNGGGDGVESSGGDAGGDTNPSGRLRKHPTF